MVEQQIDVSFLSQIRFLKKKKLNLVIVFVSYPHSETNSEFCNKCIFFFSAANGYCGIVCLECLLQVGNVGRQIKMLILKSNFKDIDVYSPITRHIWRQV